jgi:glycosyltransferase involved in cell wall biosynthesis
MNVLMICASAPTREQPRAHGFLATLARLGHAVTLVFVDRAGTVFDDLAEHCVRIRPVRRRGGLEMAVNAALAAAPFDLAHLDGPAAHLVPGPLPLPTVIDAASYGGMRRERAESEGGLLVRAARVARAGGARRCHAAIRAHGARVLVASPDDAWAFRTLDIPAEGVDVVPSLVDLERFAPPTGLREQATVALDLRGLVRTEAVAALGLAQATMALVWAQRSEARLTVIGRPPFGAAGRLAGDGRVTFTGLASSPEGHLARATLVLAPLVPGGGQAHATREAMATGAPVVGTSGLAHELGATPGQELAVALTPATAAQAILELFDDPPYRGRIGRAGRRLVELAHGPRIVGAAIETVYAAAVGSSIAAWRLEVGLDEARREVE